MASNCQESCSITTRLTWRGNKEDRELKALAEKGGVIGTYMLPFLTEPLKQPMLKDYLQHLDHAVKVCGEDHVGIGTDVPFLHVGEEELAELKRRTEERKAAGIAAPGMASNCQESCSVSTSSKGAATR